MSDFEFPYEYDDSEDLAFGESLEQFLVDMRGLDLDPSTRILLGVAFNAGWESRGDFDS